MVPSEKSTRRSGILLHISSLPSPYGIGTLGKEAYDFVDFLKTAQVGIWQVLPIGPTGFGDSPYQSFSMYAGNPNFIDPDRLIHDGLLKYEDLRGIDDSGPDAKTGYAQLANTRIRLLRKAYSRGYSSLEKSIRRFDRCNPWLHDYALFSALKEHFDGAAWHEWPQGVRLRKHKEMAYHAHMLIDQICFHKFVQFLFFKQWFALKKYANDRGIRLFGDMPIYVAMDSADTWATPKAFSLEPDGRPSYVAGVPPDYFSQDGQLWGNPLYNWEWHRRHGYTWWTQRMYAMAALFDLVRIDHFIGFAHYYAVPADAQTAKNGSWHDGPGCSLFKTLKRTVPKLEIVAEDLGLVTQDVKKLLDACGFPGMKVLAFGFDSDEQNTHLPHNVTENTVYYTGTHDNDTIFGWWQHAGEHQRGFASSYLGLNNGQSICSALIKAVFCSDAQTAVAPMQDFLELGSEARMNTPGTLGGNWRWRLLPGQTNEALALRIRALNIESKRTEGV